MAKILIVDDSQVDRMVVRKFLAGTSHQLIELGNPENVEEVIRTEEPDVILLDIIMPQRNGYEVCRELKRNPETADIPLIFLSSRSQKSDIFWGKFQGAEDYLTKPVRAKELLDAIEKWLDQQKHVGLNE